MIDISTIDQSIEDGKELIARLVSLRLGAVKMVSGRTGQACEYVEFQPGKARFIAQKGSFGYWYVYFSTGKQTVTMNSFGPNEKNMAVEYAREQAVNYGLERLTGA